MGQAETEAEAEDLNGLEGDIFDLSFSINKSRRYHEMLCSFYGAWRDWMRIITAVAGSGAFLLVTAKVQGWAEVISAFVALWAVIDVVASPDKKAERHRKLGERFTQLAEKIAVSPHTKETYGANLAERLRIERDEPPCKRLVDLQARNDECRSRDFPPEREVPLNGWQRTLGYFFTFGMSRLERWSRAQRSASA